MQIANKAQMNQLDKEAMTTYHIPSLLLMEQAAYQVFKHIQTIGCEKILILCGAGNNAGDGLALARQLFIWHTKSVQVVMMTEQEQLSEDADTYYKIVVGMGIPIIRYKEAEVAKLLKEAECVVDALFGTGLTREVKGSYKEVIQEINRQSNCYKVSIDMPSGIACDTGEVLGVAVKADTTVTFEMLKVGLCVYPGVVYAGKVEVVPIGIPGSLRDAFQGEAETIDDEMWQSRLPKRPFRSNKGTYGKVLLIGGAKSMAGAITLATKACLKVGAGLVMVAVPDCIYPIVEGGVLEAMTIGCQHNSKGQFQEQAVETISEQMKRADTIVIGPGMGRSKVSEKLIKLILESDKPCVIDADGLYALKPYLNLIKERHAPTILTPHPGELSELIEKSIEAILDQPLKMAKAFVETYNVALVLKIERTIVASKEKVYINTTGNTGLAKGGSGDVLAGMIGGFLAQTREKEVAAALGVYGHGKVADLLLDQKGAYSLLPSELIEGLEKLFIYE